MQKFQLLKGIGFYNLYTNTGYGSTKRYLTGAVINGVVYGDTALTDVPGELSPPGMFSLSQNYPNPFNPSTKIKYTLKNREHVTLKVYNVLGNMIAEIVNEEKPAGEYEAEFNAAEYGLASGVYFYTIRAGDFTETKKLILMK